MPSAGKFESAYRSRRRYRAASAREKRQILSEFVAVSGYHQKYAIQLLNAAEPSAAGRRGRVRVRTFAGWHKRPPGCMAMDLVTHCGDVNRGSYVHSLALTNIASGWIECAPLIVRESTLLVETLNGFAGSLP